MKKALDSPWRRNSWMPAGESQCVWMSAGVLTFKLCHRRFDCEHCLLHRALSAEGLEPERRAKNLPLTWRPPGPIH